MLCTHHKFKFSEAFTVTFWYIFALLEWMIFHFRNVSLNDIGVDHQILVHVRRYINKHTQSESIYLFSYLVRFFFFFFSVLLLSTLLLQCWCENKTDFMWYFYQPLERWTISTIFLVLDHVSYQWCHPSCLFAKSTTTWFSCSYAGIRITPTDVWVQTKTWHEKNTNDIYICIMYILKMRWLEMGVVHGLKFSNLFA